MATRAGRRYRPYQQRQQIEQEVGARKTLLDGKQKAQREGLVADGEYARQQIKDTDRLTGQVKRDAQRLRDMTPPSRDEVERTAQERGVQNIWSKAKKRRQQLIQVMQQGGGGHFPRMRTIQEMQSAPHGAAPKHLQWEKQIASTNVDANGKVFRVDKTKGQQSMLDEFRDITQTIYKDREEWDSTMASVESFRPDKARNDDMVNYAARSYAIGSNISKEEWNEMFGTEGLNPVAAQIAELEEDVPMPDMAEQFERLYAPTPVDDKRCQAKTNSGERCRRQSKPEHYLCPTHDSKKPETVKLKVD